MPKSRTRKNHKKKVAVRNMKLKNEAKKMETAMEDLQKAYVEEMAKKAKEPSAEDSGDVPFTLGGDK
jgi:hypothetical protein|tara:strand:+ start:608 stop:808 length:201 start_codon:yes stop_codon:yes gene_type:complete